MSCPSESEIRHLDRSPSNGPGRPRIPAVASGGSIAGLPTDSTGEGGSAGAGGAAGTGGAAALLVAEIEDEIGAELDGEELVEGGLADEDGCVGRDGEVEEGFEEVRGEPGVLAEELDQAAVLQRGYRRDATEGAMIEQGRTRVPKSPSRPLLFLRGRRRWSPFRRSLSGHPGGSRKRR